MIKILARFTDEWSDDLITWQVEDRVFITNVPKNHEWDDIKEDDRITVTIEDYGEKYSRIVLS